MYKSGLRLLYFAGIAAGVALFTAVSQIGGLALLLAYLFTSRYKDKMFLIRNTVMGMAFLVFYLALHFIAAPALARASGKKALPRKEKSAFPIAPANSLYVWLNRNYVDKELYDALKSIAVEFKETHPESTLLYLDAAFPIGKKFPLIPHLSHKTGRELDLAFQYVDEAGKPVAVAANGIGYGTYVDPLSSEENTLKRCRKENKFYGSSRWLCTIC